MKKIIEVNESSGLISLLGEKVILFCANYFYVGILTEISDDCVLLKNPSKVYETGSWAESTYKDLQQLPQDIYVMKSFIESFMKSK